MTEQEYLEIPWSMEDTIENMKLLKDIIQKMVIKENLHGKGEQDAKEVAFDFDRAIKALEKQISLQRIVERLEERKEGYLKQYEKTFTASSRRAYESYDDAIDIIKEEGGLNGQM